MNNWKVAASLMIAASFFVVVACQEQILMGATETANESTKDIPVEVQLKLEELKKNNPDKEYIEYIVIDATTEEGKNKIASLDHNSIASINVIKPKTKPSETARTFLLVELNDRAQQIAETSTTSKIYTVVEGPAEPEGGSENFYKYIFENIKYPKEASLKKISGKVYVEITVQQDGTLTDLKILKSADKSLDDEALRIVREGPKWLPAKQNGIAVSSKFVLPISFKMKDNENQTEK